MKKHLYDDFYEGFLHIIVLLLPILIGMFSELKTQSTSPIPVSLLIAILGSIYSARELYKDERYGHIRRIKLEIIISSIILAVSLFWTFSNLQDFFVNKANPDYTMPVYIYAASILPFLIEMLSVIWSDLGITGKRKRNYYKKKVPGFFDFDVTSGNIN